MEKYRNVETSVGSMTLKKLGYGYTRKGEPATWFKCKEIDCTYFVALSDTNRYIESSDFDPRDDYDFIPCYQIKPV